MGLDENLYLSGYSLLWKIYEKCNYCIDVYYFCTYKI